MKIKSKQASNAGVSRQCLKDKMSKGARNVDMKQFLEFFTHIGPLKGVNMSPQGASSQMKIIKIKLYI